MDESGEQYEIDSLCGFLKLSRSYFQRTNDSSFMNENCTYARLLPTAALT